ncbi:hypothetical protein BDQ17DRAFT_1543328 [Cyathus striatus]|nr:hypothetical protein BDQ17DRAFT_1543328 [Cyathus striatus]
MFIPAEGLVHVLLLSQLPRQFYGILSLPSTIPTIDEGKRFVANTFGHASSIIDSIFDRQPPITVEFHHLISVTGDPTIGPIAPAPSSAQYIYLQPIPSAIPTGTPSSLSSFFSSDRSSTSILPPFSPLFQPMSANAYSFIVANIFLSVISSILGILLVSLLSSKCRNALFSAAIRIKEYRDSKHDNVDVEKCLWIITAWILPTEDRTPVNGRVVVASIGIHYNTSVSLWIPSVEEAETVLAYRRLLFGGRTSSRQLSYRRITVESVERLHDASDFALLQIIAILYFLSAIGYFLIILQVDADFSAVSSSIPTSARLVICPVTENNADSSDNFEELPDDVDTSLWIVSYAVSSSMPSTSLVSSPVEFPPESDKRESIYSAVDFSTPSYSSTTVCSGTAHPSQDEELCIPHYHSSTGSSVSSTLSQMDFSQSDLYSAIETVSFSPSFSGGLEDEFPESYYILEYITPPSSPIIIAAPEEESIPQSLKDSEGYAPDNPADDDNTLSSILSEPGQESIDQDEHTSEHSSPSFSGGSVDEFQESYYILEYFSTPPSSPVIVTAPEEETLPPSSKFSEEMYPITDTSDNPADESNSLSPVLFKPELESIDQDEHASEYSSPSFSGGSVDGFQESYYILEYFSTPPSFPVIVTAPEEESLPRSSNDSEGITHTLDNPADDASSSPISPESIQQDEYASEWRYVSQVTNGKTPDKQVGESSNEGADSSASTSDVSGTEVQDSPATKSLSESENDFLSKEIEDVILLLNALCLDYS